MDKRGDRELVAAIARRDEAAFTLLYERHLPLVLSWCLRQTRNRELAADLCAEVFAASLIAASRYRGDNDDVPAWLLGIARNKLRESRRRGRIEDRALRRMGVEPDELTSDDLERVVELASIDVVALGALIDALPEDLRRPLLDRVVQERPYAEIAAELRCSELLVRQRVSRPEALEIGNGEAEMTQKDFFARTEDKLAAGVRRGAHLPWPARARLRWRSLTRHSRALAVVLAGLIVVGPALAATGVLNSGSPVPPAKRQVATVGNGVALRHGVELTALRVADPDGGPAWGLRLTETSRVALCPVVGRVEHDQIGALGIDGAFHNDRLFHPYAADYPNYTFDGMSCASTDAQGYGFVFDTWFGAPTSASLRGESTHGVVCFGRWIEPPAIAAFQHKRHPVQPAQTVCPPSEVRDIYFGLLGPDAKEIAYLTASGRVHIELTAGADGAYLVVLPHSPHNDPSTGSGPGPNRPPIVGIGMRSGDNCGVLGPQHPRRPLSDCAHQGFTVPSLKAPAEAAVRSPIKVVPVRREYQPHAVSISFIARAAVQSTRSYYAASVTNPPHKNPGAPSNAICGAGGAGGGIDHDVHTGQRLKLIIDTSDLCYGEVHGIVEYVIDRTPEAGFLRVISPPITNRTSRFYTVRIVGHFTYKVPRSKISP